MKNDRSNSYGQIQARVSRQALVSGMHKTVTCALLLVATAAAFAQQSADPFLPSPGS